MPHMFGASRQTSLKQKPLSFFRHLNDSPPNSFMMNPFPLYLKHPFGTMVRCREIYTSEPSTHPFHLQVAASQPEGIHLQVLHGEGPVRGDPHKGHFPFLPLGHAAGQAFEQIIQGGWKSNGNLQQQNMTRNI